MNEEERRVNIDQITGALPFPSEIREDFGAFVADTVMGGVWSRSGLSPRERSLITIAALTALDRPNELRLHLGMGLDNGLERAEICEIIMHMAVYGGFPVAVEGMRIAKEIFEGRDTA
ncbi:MAG: 4-carboxymuconolactone decarboxylase [Deltaproteobacteria bacterium]|jgi:4-carboxymuconolactone decarboxylase|nr:4-carboxymuconolactone decarboxylase [Deltaproteobacteria bacterium]